MIVFGSQIVKGNTDKSFPLKKMEDTTSVLVGFDLPPTRLSSPLFI